MTSCMRLPPFLLRGTTREGPLPERSTNLWSEKITSLNTRARCCGHTVHPGCHGARERLCERLVQTKPRLVIDTTERMSGRPSHLARLGRAARGRAARGVAPVRARPGLQPRLLCNSGLACQPAVRVRTLTVTWHPRVCSDLVFSCLQCTMCLNRPCCDDVSTQC